MLRLFFILMLLQSCSLIKMESKYYKKEDGAPIQKQEMDFEDKQALAKGATVNSKVINEIYYNGTEAKSKEAKIALEFSYEVMGIFGVNTDFDIDNLESVKNAQLEMRKAVEESNRIIAKLEADVKAKELEKRNIVRDKEAELEANNGKWQAKWGSLFWGWIWTIAIVFIAAIVLQVWSGVPIFTWMFKGGINTIGMLKNGLKQTVSAVGDTIKELEETTKDDKLTEAERIEAKYWLDKMKENLKAKQDEIVKEHIKIIKEKSSTN